MSASTEPIKSATSSIGDLAGEAVHRLRALVFVFAFMTLFATVMTTLVHLRVMSLPFHQDTTFNYWVLFPASVASIAMIAITHSGRPPSLILDCGLVFQVVGGFLISLLEQQSAREGVPALSMWILTFTLLPVTPVRAALAAYTTAIMLPTAMFVHVGIGDRPAPGTTIEWFSLISVLLAALISTFISKVMYGLGREVEKARKMGAYELVEELGHGGMGEVWRAEHHSLVRPAAVKLMRRELTDRLTAAQREALDVRFQREVQSTAMLSSPHTVAIFDFGHTPDGALYYVMELLHGLDAETLVEEYGPQPAERVVYLLRQACESLAEAHARNLVHRDVKPANIYLCAIGLKVDFVKMLDFGLVRNLSSDVRVTHEDAVAGTPAYVAPEAAARKVFDARSDIYAIGCVAYYMLTGQLVFDGMTAASVMAAHIRDQPVPPSQRSELPIPPELDALVLACLAKNPDDRPQTAQELQERLRAIPFGTPWNQTRAVAWWEAHVPELVARACEDCKVPPTPAAPRRRPAPIVRDTVGTLT